MTIIRPSSVRVFFDDKLIGNARASADQAVRLDTEAFYDASKSDLDFAAARSKEMRGEFTMHMDIENQQRLQQFLMYPYQKEAMERISKLAGRAAPFEFCPPQFYHGDMLRNTEDRRITFMRPSNVGKTTAMVIQPRGSYGKLSAYASRLYERTAEMQEAADWINRLKDLLRAEPDEVRDSNGKWHRAGPHSPTPNYESIRSSYLRFKVKDICNNWGKYK